ncbi:hypothetical protein [Roseovarius pacificus]|uniref:hypothetical protein n=1 Tax=Roseovarius pacificus TaxID=337701 RepID=UPI0040395FFE
MTDVYTAFVEQILDVAQRQRKSHIHHHCQADDLGAGFEVFEWVAFFHGGRVGRQVTSLKSGCSDTASQVALTPPS